MDESLKISCIIPTCNRPIEFLKEAIGSVLKQTFEPHEIIIINNGDQPVRLPEDILAQVKLRNIIPRAGVAQARNFGACLAEGNYLAFLDDDDLWSPTYLENVAQVLRSGTLCAISRLDKLIDGKIMPFKNAHGILSIENILVFNPGVTGTNVVIDKNLFFKVGGYDPKLPPSEDKSLLLEVLRIGAAVRTLPDNQAIVREHGGTRLTNADRIAEGVWQFVHKYYFLMDISQRLDNWRKVYRNKYKVGDKISGLQFLILKLISISWSIIQKIKKFI